MSLFVADRIFETTTTTGTGPINLNGPVANFRGFVAAGADGKLVPYLIDDTTNWEVGIGTITDASPDTLSRTTVIGSSNANALVNWGVGTRNVRLGLSAKVLPARDENLNNLDEFATTTGSTATAHVITKITPCLQLSTGMKVRYFNAIANTGAVTINVDGKGAKALQLEGLALLSGQLPAGILIEAVYDGTAFQLALVRQNETQATVASAASTALATAGTRNILLSGTTTITDFGASGIVGRLYNLRFTGILTLTHNSTTLIIPGGANITTAAGDSAIVEDLGSNNWRVRFYQRANGQTIVNTTFPTTPGALNTSILAFYSGTATFGMTLAGSNLVPASCNATNTGSAQTGTWQCLGGGNGASSNGSGVTLWQRIA